MNINEFNQLKTRLALHRWDNQVDALHYAILLEELQPPTPPKCVTCRYVQIEDEGVTVNCGKAFFVANPIPILNGSNFKRHIGKFGCSEHSDYEE